MQGEGDTDDTHAAHQLAAHLCQRAEHVFDAGPWCGDAAVALRLGIFTINTVGYGGRPPLARDGLGAAPSMLAASASKSTCLVKPTSGSPIVARRTSRSCSANRLIRGFIIVVLVGRGLIRNFTEPASIRLGF